MHENYEKTERENQTLKSWVDTLESKLLESNLIMQGVPEDAWEIEENQREKVVTVSMTLKLHQQSRTADEV